MDQNKKNNMKNFIKREGFYLVLFVCLCVVATAAAFAIKNNKNDKKAEENPNEFTLNVEEKADSSASEIQRQNAERVQGNDQVAEQTTEEQQQVATEEQNQTATEEQKQVADATGEQANAKEEEAAVSNTDSQVVFSLPLEGSVARAFGNMVRIQENADGTVDQTRKGIDLTTAVGTVVKVAAEGKVEEVAQNVSDGNYVVVAHANGLKTKYANLSPEVNVAVGDYVEQGAEIGTVGNSSEIFTSSICGDVLNLQIQDANGADVDPAKYFNF